MSDGTTTYVAPARYVLTVLHLPGPGWDVDRAVGVDPHTRCGLVMTADECWQVVERHPKRCCVRRLRAARFTHDRNDGGPVLMPMIRCRYCESDHGDLLLCQPAKRVLDALVERGMSFDMPTLEFPEPVEGGLGLGEDVVLVRQLVVKAATIPIADIPRPALLFTGRDASLRTLPQWFYPGTPDEIRKAVKLVRDVGEMAVRGAEKARRGG